MTTAPRRRGWRLPRDPPQGCSPVSIDVDALFAGVVELLAAAGAPLVAWAGEPLGPTVAGAGAWSAVTVTPVTSPLIANFCFLDDVGIGRRGDPAPRCRMRSG